MLDQATQLSTDQSNKNLTLVLTGGGSGGHITPLLAVAEELKKHRPDVQLVYIGERGGKFRHLLSDQTIFDSQHFIFAGKFRRFHGESLLRRIFAFKTNFLNVRDAFKVFLGFVQSYFLLKKLKPTGVFIKGGFVVVPVGKIAGYLGIPYVTHDSDTVPGLANRLLAKKAALHAVGMPAEFYDYPKSKTRYVGIPISQAFTLVSEADKQAFRKELGIDEFDPVVFVSGGSLGAQRLSKAMAGILPELVRVFPNIMVLHQVGKGNQDVYKSQPEEVIKHVKAVEFIGDLYRYSGAADVVVMRAGATSIAEMAAQGKACILVPNPLLTDGHQSKNAEHLTGENVAAVVTEKELERGGEALRQKLNELLTSKQLRKNLGDGLHKLAHPNSARELADVLIATLLTDTET